MEQSEDVVLWRHFNECINIGCHRCVAVRTRSEKKGTAWWNEDLWMMVEEKKRSWIMLNLQENSDERREKYRT